MMICDRGWILLIYKASKGDLSRPGSKCDTLGTFNPSCVVKNFRFCARAVRCCNTRCCISPSVSLDEKSELMLEAYVKLFREEKE